MGIMKTINKKLEEIVEEMLNYDPDGDNESRGDTPGYYYTEDKEDYIEQLKSTLLEAIIEAIKKESNPKYKNKIECNCPCGGPFCNTFVHLCDQPEKHYPQRERTVVDIKNKALDEYTERIEKLLK